jgi:Coenzyme PQQ synthesis protein D (PqqD)
VIDVLHTKPGLTPHPAVLSRRLDHAIVLVHTDTNQIFELNETASRAWELLGQGLDLDSIVDQLVDEFEVERPRAVDELQALVIRLQAEGLLVS